MPRTSIRSIVCAFYLAAGMPCALAISISSLSDYVRIAGEVGAGRLECNFAHNPNLIKNLGIPFQTPEGEASSESVSNMLAMSMADSLSRLRDEGLEVGCPRLLNAYGPQGTIVPGLLNSPGSE
jgi:hypothetical protein